MSANASHRTQAVVTPEGWIVDSLRQFRLLVDHPPPRPYGYIDQLREDVRDGWFVALSLIGVGFIVLAVASGAGLIALLGGVDQLSAGRGPLVATLVCLIAVPGVRCLLRLFLLVRAAVRTSRDSPLCVAIIGVLGPPTGLHGVVIAPVRLKDGRQAQVVLSPALASAIHQVHAEVMFLYLPTPAYSIGVAVRPIPSPTNPA